MFDQTLFTIHRATGTATGKKTYDTTGRSIRGTVIPLDTDLAEMGLGAFAKSASFRSMQVSADLKDGDRLVGATGTYEVKGVARHTFGLKHLVAAIELCN